MDFELTEEHRQIQRTLAEFAEREIKPNSTKWDKEEIFPREVVAKLGELGFFGVSFPEQYGGGGADTLSAVLVVEGLSRYDASVGLTAAAQMSLATGHIAKFASEQQRRRYLPDLIRARKLGAWCLTEPGGGSDAAGMKTRASRVGDNFVISGSKMFITNGTVGEVYVVTAVTDPTSRHGGVSAFIVERGTPGLSNGRKIQKLGLRASDTAEVIFDNVTVAADNLIGEVGAGWDQVLAVLDSGRIMIAGFGMGIARGAFEEARSYALGRVQFGRPIAEFQAIQWMLADMATRIDASWVLIARAAQLKDLKKPYGRQAAMAKLYASETAMWAATKSVQIHGGYGYISDFPVERYMRDAKLAEIGEGTSEVLRMVIARSLLRDGYLPA
jgi:alkylation response protein AidB-like acyl-CoA dehydrogenase